MNLFVLYHPPPYPDGTPQPPCPAIVQFINEDGTRQLWVFGPRGGYMPLPATEGEGPYQWSPL